MPASQVKEVTMCSSAILQISLQTDYIVASLSFVVYDMQNNSIAYPQNWINFNILMLLKIIGAKIKMGSYGKHIYVDLNINLKG